MKSKTSLILALIAIITVSSFGVVAYVLFPPTHGQLEIIGLEPINDLHTKVYLRWYGNEMDIQCAEVGTVGATAGATRWTEHVSYGYVFNVVVPKNYYDIYFCFEDKEVHLYARAEWATLRLRGGELYFSYGDAQPKW